MNFSFLSETKHQWNILLLRHQSKFFLRSLSFNHSLDLWWLFEASGSFEVMFSSLIWNKWEVNISSVKTKAFIPQFTIFTVLFMIILNWLRKENINFRITNQYDPSQHRHTYLVSSKLAAYRFLTFVRSQWFF
jgi:hypothetical protein